MGLKISEFLKILESEKSNFLHLMKILHPIEYWLQWCVIFHRERVKYLNFRLGFLVISHHNNVQYYNNSIVK